MNILQIINLSTVIKNKRAHGLPIPIRLRINEELISKGYPHFYLENSEDTFKTFDTRYRFTPFPKVDVYKRLLTVYLEFDNQKIVIPISL